MSNIIAAEVVLPCAELQDTLSFFTRRLGFRLESILPADDPSVAVLSGYGLRLRLVRGLCADPGALRLLCRAPKELSEGPSLRAPNGTRIELVEDSSSLVLPPLQPSFVVSQKGDDAQWHTGRAGMRYRDLIPGRLGGRFIASHIVIPEGGPVPDYVHFHKIRLQLIYCYKGWVKVVYEDQGPPFVMQAGDCVLQPPQIRHRVLESSANLEVIELSSPAAHETLVEHHLSLPTPNVTPQRDFYGQRFMRFQAKDSVYRPARLPGFEAADLGVGAATDGAAGVYTVRPTAEALRSMYQHEAELVFWFVLSGGATLKTATLGEHALSEGSSVVLPAGFLYSLTRCSADFELLEVRLPDRLQTTPQEPLESR